jgi:hypothetical protein
MIDFGRLIYASLVREAEIDGSKRSRRHTNSASGLGHPCLRKLVLDRVQPEDATPWDAATLGRFSLGRNLEHHVRRLLEDAGIDIFSTQMSSRWEEYNISGHIDGMVRGSDIILAYGRLGIDGAESVDPDEVYVAEIKGLNPFTYAALHTAADFLDQAFWCAGYLVQMVLYLWLEEKERGLFLIFDKSGAGLKTIEVLRDEWIDLAEETLQKCERIERFVRIARKKSTGANGISTERAFPMGMSGEDMEFLLKHGEENDYLPKRICDPDICPGCNYEHVCCPTLAYGPEVEEIIDPALWADVYNARRAKKIASEYTHLRKRIKARLELTGECREHTWLILDPDQADPYYMKVTAKRSKSGSVTHSFDKQELTDDDD